MGDANFVSRTQYEGPSCTLCGAAMQYKCLSCGSTPAPTVGDDREKFEAWWPPNEEWASHEVNLRREAAFEAWQARQPEIDQLTRERDDLKERCAANECATMTSDMELAKRLHIEYCEDLIEDGTPWEVPAEPGPQYFAELADAIEFLVNLPDLEMTRERDEARLRVDKLKAADDKRRLRVERLTEALQNAVEQLWEVKNGLMDMRESADLHPQRESWIAAKIEALFPKPQQPKPKEGM